MNNAREWANFKASISKIDAKRVLVEEEYFHGFDQALHTAVDQLDTELKQAKATLPADQMVRYFETLQTIAEKDVYKIDNAMPGLSHALEELRQKFVRNEDFREELQSEERTFGKTNLDRALEPVYRAASVEGLATIAYMVWEVGGMPLIKQNDRKEGQFQEPNYTYVNPEEFQHIRDANLKLVPATPRIIWKGNITQLTELFYLLERMGLTNLEDYYKGKDGLDLGKLSRAILQLFELQNINDPILSLNNNGLKRLKKVTLGKGPILMEEVRSKEVFGIKYKPLFTSILEN